MPWVTRGISNGTLTTGWPKQPDVYFDEFPAAVTVTDSAGRNEDGVDSAANACPTQAISRTTDGTVRLDRGLCILCGRCTRVAPDTFAWQSGSATAGLSRRQIIVDEPGETDAAIAAVRGELAARVKRLRRSVHIRHVDAGSDGSDEWEVQALTNPVYDLHRLGIFFTASPRHADILLVTGIGTEGMVEPLQRTYDAMPEPVIVIATGADAISGGLVGRGYTSGVGIERVLDVDVWVPGSPASPFALLHAILSALDRLPAARARTEAT